MKKETKKLLDSLAKVNDENKKLFDKKAKLENEILEIDIDIFKLSGEYNSICEKLIKEI